MEIFSKSDVGLVRAQNQDDFRFGVIAPNCVWAVVCDGMGGANGGNIAKITDLYKSDMTKEQIRELMAEIVLNANNQIFEQASHDPELAGMGTTCEFVFVKDTTVLVVHVGDSRTYSIRGGKIKQLTEDIKTSVRLDYIEASFMYGDVLLICSDGLSNHVTTGEMVKICHENRGEDLVNKLIDSAKAAGGSDNITATVIY